MARDLASIKAFFQGIDDQQSYEQKAAEELRRQQEEERRQQKSLQDQDIYNRQAQEYNDNQAVRDLNRQTAIDKFSSYSDNAETRKALEESQRVTDLVNAQTNKLFAGKVNPEEAATARAAAFKNNLEQSTHDSAVKTWARELAQANPGFNDPAVLKQMAAAVGNAKTPQEAQALSDAYKLNLIISPDGKTFKTGAGGLDLDFTQIGSFIQNPAGGAYTVGQNMVKSAQGSQKADTAAAIAASNIAKNESVVEKNEASASYTAAKEGALTADGSTASAPAVIPTRPVATPQAQTQAKPPTPQQTAQATATAQANQQAMDKIAVLKKAAADATANYQAAHQKYVRLVNGGGGRAEAQQAALERTRLQALMDQAVKAAQ